MSHIMKKKRRQYNGETLIAEGEGEGQQEGFYYRSRFQCDKLK